MGRPSFYDANVEFVILTWNCEAYLVNCLNSVLSLECHSLRVWIVDNGSTDGTLSLLERFAAGDSRVRVIAESENLGTTVSRNIALRQIDPGADYVCVLDSDTVVNQGAFEILANALLDKSIGVVGPSMASSDGALQLSGRMLPTLGIKLGKACPFGGAAKKAADAERPQSPIAGGLQDVGYLLSACWLIPTDVLKRVGRLDEKIFYAPEDVDWCVRCHKAGYRVVWCHGARITHEYQRLSHKKVLSKTNCEHLKGLLHYFAKHRYLFRAPDFPSVGRGHR